MSGALSIPQLILSILLFAVLFFGIGFIVNMLLKTTWLIAILYPFFIILIIDHVSIWDYFTNTSYAFSDLWISFINLKISDIVVLAMGLVGAIIAGITIRTLRKKGYQMF
ncbi:hypothetical protein JOD43_000598 [Pullulanibacillus pueri]|uniref:Uncharacterized protein n=1 Tax=Pullulanibacillus pueri TaxID=1437324 RepID=A0A8J2ZTF1_9BACL|nr:YuiB family protein [Pullulanibacillus pueri]MBM7680439.1 hypothetical protein [Pullulanibacillus pueri]GGH75085.1 hypothetical protein GCM10007096_03940 [Pullulanibacillus pueri]